jgi:hypothetical protein
VKKPKARLDAWAEAQKRFHLSDLHIQMARELGLNPKKCGGLATHRQEPWKLPDVPETRARDACTALPRCDRHPWRAPQSGRTLLPTTARPSRWLRS